MSSFGGFDLTGVVEVRIRSYTVGPGGTAQLVALGLEVQRVGAAGPELVEIDFEEDGPTLATAEAVVVALNRLLRQRLEPGA